MSLEFEKAYSLQQPPAEGGGEEINNQDIQVTENGIYTAEDGYTGLGTVTVSVADSFAPIIYCTTNVTSEVQ